MKIYIENYNMKQLSSQIKNFDKFNKTSYPIIRVYSEEGIFEIDENNIYKINLGSDAVSNVVYKNWSVFIDECEINKKRVYYLPQKHYFENSIVRQYSISKTSKEKMVIIFDEKNIPVDFYIEAPFMGENLNVFLSALN